MSSTTTLVQMLSITSALAGGGGMAYLSFIDIPALQSQPAERSLPTVRWIFSRGSHLFPQAAYISTAGFSYLAYNALPLQLRTFAQLFKTNSTRVNGYLAAAISAIGILPFTRFVMLQNNLALMNKNAEKGGARSAHDSQASGQTSQFTDLSGPQAKTTNSFSDTEEREVREMLGRFALQNYGRVFLLGGAGVLGLWIAVTQG